MTDFNENFKNEYLFSNDKKETPKTNEPNTVPQTEDIVEDVRPGKDIREENPKK